MDNGLGKRGWMIMVRKDVFKHGSTWLRADFHLHTRCDHTFKYSDDDDYYLFNYVDALKKEGISIGVITNHNQFDYEEFLALQKTAKGQCIMLLPGVELRVKEGANGIHTLVTFSDEWLQNGEDLINEFLSVAFKGKAPSKRRESLTSVGLLGIIDKLESYGKDFFVVFAHVEDRSGLWKELRGGRIMEFGRNEKFRSRTLGFQKVRTCSRSESGKSDRQKVKKWLEDWYPAEVEGSDPKSIEQIGEGAACYLKIGDWSFNAVKYALVDHRARVAKVPIIPNHSYIKDIMFEGGALDGHTISLSPALNTLIGIRGSGKSSIIEAIRYAFNIPLGDMVKDGDPYKEGLPAFVLGSGGKITVRTVDRHGQEYEVCRIYGESPDVFVEGNILPGISLRETVLRNPIYFGQKDLSNTSSEFEKGLIERIFSDKLSDIRTQIEAQNQEVRGVITRLKKTANVEEKLAEYQGKKDDAEYRLGQYSAYGVEEKLQKQLEYDSDARKCVEVITTAQAYLNGLEGLLAQYEDELKNHLHYKSTLNSEFFTEFFGAYSQIVATTGFFYEQIEQVKATITELVRRQKVFGKQREGLKNEFAEIERKLAEDLKDKIGSKPIDTKEFRQLRTVVDQSTQMLRALKLQQQEQGQLETRLEQELAKLKTLWHKEFVMLKKELEKINEADAPIKIEAKFKGDYFSYLEFFKNIFKGSRIREDTFRSFVNKYVDFIEIHKDFESVIKALNPSLRDKFHELFWEYQADLLTYQVPNTFDILYHGVSLRKHSLGQRASALILFILSQEDNDVIIIDQPEDDLDNQTIYEDVIKLILRLKSKAQFVFATHNANFPVLGDAEQVITCEYDSTRIKPRMGSIDKPETQHDIISIMEGGEEAFKKRGRKYRVWKPQNS